MLVLDRREGQSIVVAGELITFRVLRIIGNRVKIGVVAPDDIEIDREEVRKRKVSKEKGAA